MTAPSRPALRYHGGKFRMAPWIISHFPEHDCYVEPFGGGGSVLLRKPPAHLEVYNDLNGDVANFFRVLRERPADLIAAIEFTPFARAEFLAAQLPCDDPLERARRTYVWSWQGRGRAGVEEAGGWRYMSRATRATTPVDDWNNHGHLWSVVERLKRVQFECDDALRVIERFDEPQTLFYVDPPYVARTRGNRWGTSAYCYEYTDQDHRRLAEALHGVAGMVIVSGYPSALYDELYAGWRVVTRRESKDNGVRAATECLWLSPRVSAWQPSMFEIIEGVS